MASKKSTLKAIAKSRAGKKRRFEEAQVERYPKGHPQGGQFMPQAPSSDRIAALRAKFGKTGDESLAPGDKRRSDTGSAAKPKPLPAPEPEPAPAKKRTTKAKPQEETPVVPKKSSTTKTKAKTAPKEEPPTSPPPKRSTSKPVGQEFDDAAPEVKRIVRKYGQPPVSQTKRKYDSSYYDPFNGIVMQKSIQPGGGEHKAVYRHEYGHFLDSQLGGEPDNITKWWSTSNKQFQAALREEAVVPRNKAERLFDDKQERFKYQDKYKERGGLGDKVWAARKEINSYFDVEKVEGEARVEMLAMKDHLDDIAQALMGGFAPFHGGHTAEYFFEYGKVEMEIFANFFEFYSSPHDQIRNTPRLLAPKMWDAFVAEMERQAK